MHNLLSLSEFIRHLKEKELGYSAVWFVPVGKEYSQVVNALMSIASREKIKISTSQVLIVDCSSLETTPAIKVTRK